MMDNHEYLTNLLYDEFTSIHSLKEERGRIPEIKAIIDDVTTWVLSQMQNGMLHALNIIYQPSFDTFFKSICFHRINISLSTENAFSQAEVDLKQFKWNGYDLMQIPMEVFIKTKQEDLEYNIKRVIGHELLHAYEFYKKRLKGLDMLTPKQKSYYRYVRQCMNENEPLRTFAYVVYYNTPIELRAFSQGIQMELFQIWEKEKLEDMPDNLPFQWYKEHIQEFKTLRTLKEGLKIVLKNNDDYDIIEAMLTLGLNQCKTSESAKQCLYAMIDNIEETYNKALSRAIEKCRLDGLYEMKDNFNYYSVLTEEEKFRNKKVREIFEKYGDNKL